MVSNRQLIIQLLIQDMKHEQLVSGLRSLGFDSNLHGSDISAVVAELMGINATDMSMQWMDVYMSFVKKAGDYTITDTGSSLQALAETCYTFLLHTSTR